MIHVITFESGLSNVLTFEHSEFLSEVDEVRGSNKTEIKIVASEDVIKVVILYLIDCNGEIFQSYIRSGTCGNRFRTDGQ